MPGAGNYKIDNKFHKILQGEDSLGVVVRAHIHIEQQLNELLSLLCYEYNFIEDNLGYYQKVSLAGALGLTPEYVAILRALGKLRNDFAHEQGVELNKKNVSILYNAFSSVGKRIIQDVYNKLRKKMPNVKAYKSFRKLQPNDQFVFLVVTLQSRLRSVISRKKDTLKRGELTFRCECGKEHFVELTKNFNEQLPKGEEWSCPECKKKYQFLYNFIRE